MSETSKIFKCKCDDPGFIVIDVTNKNVVCGVKGAIDQGNVRLTNGTASCASCNVIIYEDK